MQSLWVQCFPDPFDIQKKILLGKRDATLINPRVFMEHNAWFVEKGPLSASLREQVCLLGEASVVFFSILWGLGKKPGFHVEQTRVS